MKEFDITIDARMINNTGIGTYIKSMVANIVDNYSITLLGNSHSLNNFHWSNKVKVIETKSPIYSISEQLELQKKIPSCPLFISPHYNIPLLKIKALKRAVIIHDVNHLVNINKLTLFQKLYARYMINAAMKKSDKIITVSEFSKNEIINYANTQGKDIRIIYCGLKSEDFKNKTEVQLNFNLPENYLLFVGSLKTHKNIDVVLKALSLISTNEKLVIIGISSDQLLAKIENYKIIDWESKIIPLKYVHDSELPLIYKNAKCLIFPSIYEGFGLPPLEAMIYGCPVIASNTASIPEVCGDAALYFNPHNADELLHNIQLINENKYIMGELVQKGYKNIERFSPGSFTEKLIYEFNSIISN